MQATENRKSHIKYIVFGLILFLLSVGFVLLTFIKSPISFVIQKFLSNVCSACGSFSFFPSFISMLLLAVAAAAGAALFYRGIDGLINTKQDDEMHDTTRGGSPNKAPVVPEPQATPTPDAIK
jgi:ABC-type multidrug transport system fused ATPase/permease subunit